MNPNFDNVGKTFSTFYYQSFDTNRTMLKSLYRDHSMLTFEGEQFQGTEAIIKKLTSLPFQQVQHVVTTVDCQPTPSNGVLVFVVGQLKADNDPAHSFSQTFLLMPENESLQSYFVLNDLFRLSLHHG